jgi:hypothetical protein
MEAQTMLFLLVMALLSRAARAILNDGPLVGEDGDGRCAFRVQRALDSMRRPAGMTGSRRSSQQATIDLAGYALHQPLRSAPYDMYVTGMRVRVPGQAGWVSVPPGQSSPPRGVVDTRCCSCCPIPASRAVLLQVRVERCQFDPRNQSLDTRLLFRDLTVTGRVKLYEDAVRPAGTCSMTLRLRRAGLGFTAAPATLPALGLRLGGLGHGRRDAPGPVEVRTNARFVDPDFVSVYAHGCPTPGIEHRSDDYVPNDPSQDLTLVGPLNFSRYSDGKRKCAMLW